MKCTNTHMSRCFSSSAAKLKCAFGIEAVRVNSGGVAFVPRWAFHQTSNMSQTEELVILAITDFALTKAVLGDYDKRTRLAVEDPMLLSMSDTGHLITLGISHEIGQTTA